MALLVIITLAQLAVLGRLLFVVDQFISRHDMDRLTAENTIRGIQQQTVLALFEAAREDGGSGGSS